MNSRLRLPFVLLCAVLALTGCGQLARTDRIKAQSDTEFDTWVGDRAKLFSADEVKEIDDARQQLKYQIMADRPGLDHDTSETLLYQKINGRTVRDLLIASYNFQIENAQMYITQYQPMIDKANRLKDNPRMDDDEKQFQSDTFKKISRLMQEKQDTLARLKKRLGEVMSMPKAP